MLDSIHAKRVQKYYNKALATEDPKDVDRVKKGLSYFGLDIIGKIFGRKTFIENPDLFIKVNRNSFQGLSNTKLNNLLSDLLFQVEEAIASGKHEPTKFKDAVSQLSQFTAGREVALDFQKFISSANFYTPNEKMRLLDKIETLFRARLKNSVMDDQKIKDIRREAKESESEKKLDRYKLKLWREALALKEPTTTEALFQQLTKIKTIAESSKIGKKSYFLNSFYAAEVLDFLKRENPGELNLETLVSHLPIEAIEHFLELKNKLLRYVKENEEWPSDVGKMLDLWKTLAKSGIFPKESQQKDKILESLINSLKNTTDIHLRKTYAEKLLEERIVDKPKYRKPIEDILLDSLLTLHGKDDRTESYKKTLVDYLAKLRETLDINNRISLYSKLAEKLEAQHELSQAIREEIVGNKKEALEASQFIGSIGNGILHLTEKDPTFRNDLLDFLIQTKTPATVSKMRQSMERSGRLHADSPSRDFDLKNINYIDTSRSLEVIYEQFWASPLEARAGILDTLLFPPHNKKAIADAIFQGNLLFILDKLFPADMPYSQQSRKYLVNYGEVLEPYEKSLFLAAALAAGEKSLNQNGEFFSAGKRLAMVLELLGPAEIKLGQAIHSYQGTPDEIRLDMKVTKQAADLPLRWDLMQLYENTVPEALKNKIKRIKTIEGAASYYVVVRVEMMDGTEQALAILKENAQARSENGLRRMQKFVDRLKAQNEDPKLLDSLSELIQQTKAMTKTETDWNTALKQAGIAKKMYQSRIVEVEGEKFNFNPVTVNEAGPGYRLMSLASGPHYNDLPSKTPLDKSAKRKLGLAYHTLELSLILRGEYFDQDRHGGQMRVQDKNVQLYDFGAIELKEPSKEDLRDLGRLLFKLKNILTSNQADTAANYILDQITEKKSSGKNTDYLVALHKSWLALGDFREHMTATDYEQMLSAVLLYNNINPEIKNGFAEGMSFTEKMGAVFGRVKPEKPAIKIIQ
jgi:hypothetical protein